MFKAFSGEVSGIADVTSLYKRDPAHMQLAICVLSSFEITVFDCRMRPKGLAHGKSTRGCGRKPRPRKNSKVAHDSYYRTHTFEMS